MFRSVSVRRHWLHEIMRSSRTYSSCAAVNGWSFRKTFDIFGKYQLVIGVNSAENHRHHAEPEKDVSC